MKILLIWSIVWLTVFLILYLFSNRKERLAIPEAAIRKQFKKILTAKPPKYQDIVNLDTKLAEKNHYLQPFFHWLIDHYHINGINLLKKVPSGMRGFLMCLSSTTSVSSYIRPKADFLKMVRKLTQEDVLSDAQFMQILSIELPIMANLVISLHQSHQLLRLPKEFEIMLGRLIKKAEDPFYPQNQSRNRGVDNEAGLSW